MNGTALDGFSTSSFQPSVPMSFSTKFFTSDVSTQTTK